MVAVSRGTDKASNAARNYSEQAFHLSDDVEALSYLHRYAAEGPTEYSRDVAKAVRLEKAAELLRQAALLMS